MRREGKIPAVVYGLGADPVSISVDWPALRRALTTEAGVNALITLDIDGTNHLSVVKDIQRHPTRRDVLHVDFLRVTEDRVMVMPDGLIFLSTVDAGLDAGVDTLMELAGLESITRSVPVSFRLVFDADDAES